MKIIGHCYINPRGAFFNGQNVLIATEENYLKNYFSELKIDYSKFYKMDLLSKGAFLGDYLLRNSYKDLLHVENELQFIFANTSSSKETDIRFIESYERKKNPSPSLFVYTLPNILTGELAIKHKWFGENIFYILTKFDSDFFNDQIVMSFLRGNEYCLCGWVEMTGFPEDECFMFLVAKSDVVNENFSNKLNEILNTYRNE